MELEPMRPHCGIVSSSWSSAREIESIVFDVNIRAIMARKGQPALNDFLAPMNVSHRGLHHKTFQNHLKKFRESMEEVYAESASAMRKVYKHIDLSLCKDITVDYDGTWHTLMCIKLINMHN